MKKTLYCIIAIISLLGLFQACSKSSNKPAKDTTPDVITTVTKSRLWSGYYLDTIFYNLRPSTHLIISDGALTILKVTDSMINVSDYHMYLRYRGTDSTTHIATYDTTHINGGSGTSSLLYDYIADTMVFDYHEYFPTENPEEKTAHLYSAH